MVKLGWREGINADEAIDLIIRALQEAADEDSATGGVDLIRNIFPIVATINADGFTRVPDDDLGVRYRALMDQYAADRAMGGIE